MDNSPPAPAASVLTRAIRWTQKPSEERNRAILNRLNVLTSLPVRLGTVNFLNTFLGYQPDSQTAFHKHPEYKGLFERFTRHNRLNNAGDAARLWSFILNIKQIVEEGIEGDFAELGVWRGNTAAVLAHFAAPNHRKVYLFDTYEGFASQDLKGIDADKRMAFNDTSLAMVAEVIGDAATCCEFVKGYFPDSVTPAHRARNYSIVSLDCDLYEPMKAGLDFFYPRMSRGGLFLLHDYSSAYWAGSKKAIDEFCAAHGEYPVLMPDKSGSAFIRKTRQTRT